MNTRLTFLRIATLSLPLALLAPFGALAQAKDEPNSPPGAGRGRQAISNKLDLIRSDTVRYDGLPLSEVVNNLRDEARKRDPDKKGINFMINPNAPAEAARIMAPGLGPDGNPLPAPPPEAVDINAITVKINPPLNDVRLVDVLDAVVKVAEHPIKYTVEDYGVVFSLRGPEPARKEEIGFTSQGAGGGRQVISNKLDLIRLDTVRYDGLPLSEVVLNLRDEAKKRDPDKKGINFLINPNAPADIAPVMALTLGPDGNPLPAPPPEAVDIGAIMVKINPPLNDVRLVDVLDAVVKVAERPIKYSVEDYGVVFSLQGPEPVRKEETGFTFPGGTPGQFLDAVQRQYQVDWLSVADIPKEMADVHIPRLRINQDSLALILGSTGGQSEPLGALVSLYNQLGEKKTELGHLIVKGDLAKPSVVMFVPDKAVTDTQARIKVKAFSIYGINDAERAKLQEDIDRAKAEAMQFTSRVRGSSGLRSLEGMVAIHNDTSLLVATGPESFVDMVESIVTACLAKEHARNPAVPMALPNAPGS